jgi:hypothetical protein
VRPSDGGIALAATLHDPPGALLGAIERWLPKEFLEGFERALGRWPVVTRPLTRVTRLAGAPVRLTPWRAPRAPLPPRAPAR